MLDSRNDSDTNAASNAPGAAAFAASQTPQPEALPQEEILTVAGASWAEYHLLLGESSPHCTRIQSEIRTCGGAPTVAILLARWCAENPQTSHIAIDLNLTLGHDPNARLLRRELEKWQAKLPSLRVHIVEDAAAPEVAYRILMWPRATASTWGAPQVLEHGEIVRSYKIAWLGCEGSYQNAVWDEIGPAVLSWPGASDYSVHQKVSMAEAAQRAWENLGPHQRIACALSWAEIEAEARAAGEAQGSESV